MRSQLLLVLLLQSLNGFVVCFEFFELPFEFLATGVETLLQVKHFHAHLLHLGAVSLCELLLLLLNLAAVAFEGGLGLLAFLQVGGFELTDFLFPLGAVLCLLECVLLLCNDQVGSDEELLDLALVGVVAGRLNVVVFFVLGVEVEDDLGELSDLLAHLVVRLLGDYRNHYLN